MDNSKTRNEAVKIEPSDLIVAATTRLILRKWTPADIEPFSAIVCKPEVVRYIGKGDPWDSRIVVERRIEKIRERGYGMWAVELKKTGSLIGHCGVQPLDDTGETEIGWLLDRPYWGKGLATEAAKAALDYAMTDLGFKRIVAITQAENRASSRIMEKIGMIYERTIEWKGVEGVLMYSISHH